jgi:hypothetical protein
MTITAASNPRPKNADRSADPKPSLIKVLVSGFRVSAPAVRLAEEVGVVIEMVFTFSLLFLLKFILPGELPVSRLDREARIFSLAYTHWRTKLLREPKKKC